MDDRYIIANSKIKDEYIFFPKIFLLLLFLIAFSNISLFAQDIITGEKKLPFETYDEVPVYVIIEGIPNFYIDVIYTDNNLLYIDIYELFKALQIPCKIDNYGDIVYGFIENENNTYSLDFKRGMIKIGTRSLISETGLFKEDGGYYIDSKLFSDVFMFSVTFNYRSLSIFMKPSFELPVIKQQRLEKIRKNISKFRGDNFADTLINRRYNLLKLGSFDWSLASTQTSKGVFNNYVYAGLGTEFLFGETNISVDYYSQYKFDNRQLNYYWRWVNNENTFIKQAQIGRIFNNTISSIINPVVGVSIRNTPTTIRRTNSFNVITDVTEPFWTVELYVNNSLMDYTTADASGVYTFKVPIVYGYTTIKLKFYGPLGEERSVERNIIVPYSILPKNEFEYGVSSGIVLDSAKSIFGRTEFNYGLNSVITIGGGHEYLSSITTGANIPFVKITFQPFNKIILSGEYANRVRNRITLNYHLTKGSLFEFDYTKYVEGQRARFINTPEERSIKLSLPYRLGRTTGYSKLSYSQLVFKEFTYSQSSAFINVNIFRFSLSNSTMLNWLNNNKMFIINETSLGYKFIKGYTARTYTRFNVNENNMLSFKAEIEKKFYKTYFSASYERYLKEKQNYISLNFRYDLEFTRAAVSLNYFDNTTITSESFSGSLAYDSHNKYMHKSTNSSLSKGGLILYPFIDLNFNSIYDNNEPLVHVSKVKASGGKPIYNLNDTIIIIPDLNSFVFYNIEFSNSDLENISWRFKHNSFKVLVDPNQFKKVDVPVVVFGEVSGSSYLKNGEIKGLGRIIINLYKNDTYELIAQTLSESDGFYNYFGLPTGDYIAKIDSIQLIKLNLNVQPDEIKFSIKPKLYGDVIDNLDFILTIKDTSLKNAFTFPENEIQNEKIKPKYKSIKVDIKNDTLKNSGKADDTLNINNNYKEAPSFNDSLSSSIKGENSTSIYENAHIINEEGVSPKVIITNIKSFPDIKQPSKTDILIDTNYNKPTIELHTNDSNNKLINSKYKSTIERENINNLSKEYYNRLNLYLENLKNYYKKLDEYYELLGYSK